MEKYFLAVTEQIDVVDMILMIAFVLGILFACYAAFVRLYDFVSSRYAIAQREAEMDAYRKAQMKAAEQSRQEYRKHQQLADAAREEQRKSQLAREERERLKHEQIYWPRVLEAMTLLPTFGDFELLMRCFTTGNQKFHPELVRGLFDANRQLILEIATKRALAMNHNSIQNEVKQLLEHMQLPQQIAPLLLDLHRDVLKALAKPVDQPPVGDEFKSAIDRLLKSKKDRLETILNSEISEGDQQRFVEEIENEFSERLSSLMSNQ